MVAANLAAYFSLRQNYPNTQGLGNKTVLLIDLDYQGSLTNIILSARNIGGDELPEKSYAETLLSRGVPDADAYQFRVHPGTPLPNLSFYPATYLFDDFETREQFKWLAGDSEDDVRLRLLKRMLSPEFLNRFDLVIIDSGPRVTTALVNALAAATHVLVPTTADGRSMEATQRFLRRISTMKNGSDALPSLCPNLKAAGVLFTLTNARENDLLVDAQRKLEAVVDGDPGLSALFAGNPVFLNASLPESQPVVASAQGSVPYLATTQIRAIFNQIGAEIETRIA
jgi:chromosome partitioning protein